MGSIDSVRASTTDDAERAQMMFLEVRCMFMQRTSA
jgi:hypothetical protein